MPEEITPQANEISLRDYLDLLRRRKAIVLQTFIVVFVVGVIVTFLSKPVYRTSTRILVEGKNLTLAQVDANDPMSNLFMAPAGHDVATQIAVLQGDQVLADTYREANVPPGGVRLDVKQVETTDVIEIVVESTRPDYAEGIARTLPKTYLKYVTGNRQSDISNALAFARSRYAEENQKLSHAELALQRFKERTHLTSLEQERNERITQSVTAEGYNERSEAAVAGLQAKLDTLIAARRAEPAFVETPTTATNTQGDAIKESIAKLKTERVSLIPKYKPTHIKVQTIDAQIRELEDRLAKTPATITTTVRTANPLLRAYDERIADTRSALAGAIAEMNKGRLHSAGAASQLNRFSPLEREQAQLEREVARHRDTVTLLGKHVEDLGLREKATHPPMQVVSPAPAAAQVAPKKAQNLAYASLVGIVLGLCFALLQEFLDDRINSPEEARRLLGVPALGYVPLVEKEDSRLLNRARGGGSLLESYRVLRSNVNFAAVDAPVNSLLVTSTAPGEGKSVTASNLAVAMALDGRHVILVDSDLRRPTIHEKFGLEPSPGLTDVLIGQTTLEEALQETHIPELKVLTAGPPPPNPAELLNSRAMRDLHEEMKGRCDIVIFDSPPSLATADAQVLSADVDGVLYVVQFGEAKKSAVRHAGDLLRQARARVLGVVFNKIDLASNRDDYYYGYYRYYNYYQNGQIEDGSRRKRRYGRSVQAIVSGPNGHGGDSEELAVARRKGDEAEEEA